MNILTFVAALEQYALDNYENGGHWVYETYSRDEYLDVLKRNAFNLAKAMGDIKSHWELLVQRQGECF